MKFDRNSVIGFILLGALFLGMFWFNSKDQNRYLAEKKKVEEQQRIQRAKDSTALAQRQPKDTAKPVAQIPTAADSLGFQQALTGTESTEEVNTDVLRIVFSNKGGQPQLIELKKFKGPDSTNAKLGATGFDKISYNIATAPNRPAGIDTLYFATAEKAVSADSITTISYKLKSAEGREITHQFVVKPNNYMVDFTITIDGVQQVLGANTLNLTWQANAVRQQKDIEYERGQSKIGYYYEGGYDDNMAPGGGSKEFKGAVNWVSVKQQFFNYTLVAKNSFSGGNIIWTSPADTTAIVAQATANMQLPLQNSAKASVPLGLVLRTQRLPNIEAVWK
jgi:YidC/Oxa1 family membrane protein insertase